MFLYNEVLIKQGYKNKLITVASMSSEVVKNSATWKSSIQSQAKPKPSFP